MGRRNLVPTREGIDKYQALEDEVNQLVGEINGKLGTTDWTPVVHIHRRIGRSELAALYRIADVCWVTPLREGMNLVAKDIAPANRIEMGRSCLASSLALLNK
jgi:trehalose-6-phosphate synthase